MFIIRHSFFSVLVLTVLIMSLINPSQAESQIKGVATVQYKGWLSPNAEDERNALKQANLAAWQKYVGTFNAAKMKEYLKFEDKLLLKYNSYIISTRKIDESVDKSSKTLTVVARVHIDDTRFNADLHNLSPSNQASSGESSSFVFIFMTRRVSNKTNYETTKLTFSQRQSKNVIAQKKNETENSRVSALKKAERQSSKSGASSERKIAQKSYIISSSQNVDAAMSDVLTTANFDVINYNDVVGECGAVDREIINEDFRSGNEMSAGNRRNAIHASKACEVDFFSVGTLDVGMEDIDPVTGNKRVFVSLTAQVWNIKKRMPRKVASVGPIQFQGLGPNSDVAIANALKLAAKEGALKLVDQLNSKGIH